jgi:hypothetical protein
MHRATGLNRPAERIAWVLDDLWPETASMVEARFGPDDQLLAPGIIGGFPSRYRWPAQVLRPARLQTLLRHWSMRRIANASGAVRQRSYLDHDRAIARKLARAIDYRARHLVVAQAWLPWLDQTGALGGRTFDVVMSRYPYAEIHRLLDQAATELGDSTTIADFRADPALVARESELLQRARRIVTPHHSIAALFPQRAELLAWHRPQPHGSATGPRVAFLGPTIARQRPDRIRELARSLDQPLVVFGPIFEPLWDGVPIEHRVKGADWLKDIGTILHPATITHQPRELLEAAANDVLLYATPQCGLSSEDYLPLDLFPAADRNPASLVTIAAAG